MIHALKKKEDPRIGKFMTIVLKDDTSISSLFFAQLFQESNYNKNSKEIFNYAENELKPGDIVKAKLELKIKSESEVFYRIKNIQKEFVIEIIKDEETFEKLNKLLNITRKEIILASPWISDVGHIIQKLKRLSEKGVKVKILTRPINNKDYQIDIFNSLRESGCEIYLNKKIHCKIYLIDTILFTTSANLTPTAMLRNHELGIMINYKPLISEVRNYLNDRISESICL